MCYASAYWLIVGFTLRPMQFCPPLNRPRCALCRPSGGSVVRRRRCVPFPTPVTPRCSFHRTRLRHSILCHRTMALRICSSPAWSALLSPFSTTAFLRMLMRCRLGLLRCARSLLYALSQHRPCSLPIWFSAAEPCAGYSQLSGACSPFSQLTGSGVYRQLSMLT